MKLRFLFVLYLLITCTAVRAQNTINQVSSPENISGFRTAIDHPDLNGNPDAIIIATPPSGYEHPIAVWYLTNKWHVFNLDQASMAPRQVFSIKYWKAPDSTRFVQVARQQNVRGGRAYIDNAALNGNPSATVTVFQSMSNTRGGYWNANEAKADYDAATQRWYVANANGQPIAAGNAYNIVVEGGAQPLVTQSITAGTTAGVRPTATGTQIAGGPINYAIAPEPLRFGPTLGRKIILYPGQTGDVGLTVQGNLLQIHADNPNADVAIGYEQGGAFKERLRVKANGAIEVNGSAGQPGQVLMSRGPSEPPTWTSMPMPVHAFANCIAEGPNAVNCVAAAGADQSAPIVGLRMSLNLKKPSIVSVNGRFFGSNRIVVISGTATSSPRSMFVTANGTRVSSMMEMSYGDSSFGFMITDVMFRLEPGNYDIDWRMMAGSSGGAIRGEFASLTAYPIE